MSLFTPLLQPRQSRPPTQWITHKSAGPVLLRDTLSIPAWLALGGIFTSVAYAILGVKAFIIPAAIIILKTTNVLLIVLGVKQDPLTKNLLSGKFSAQVPNEDGTYGPVGAAHGVTVMLIGITVNHQLAMFAPGFKEAGDFMKRMQKDLSDRADEYGLHGSSVWLGAARETSNSILSVMYFKNQEGLTRFAHDLLHREAWNWWKKHQKEYSHLQLWHEAFHSSPGQWETIYENGAPLLFGAGFAPVKTATGTQYQSTIVDASKGVLKGRNGRMALSNGKDNDKYDDAAETKV